MLNELLKSIIEEQSQIIGPRLARSRAVAAGVAEYPDTPAKNQLAQPENPQVVVEKLIESYKEVFGQASVEVCISVIKRFPRQEVEPLVPNSIKSML